MPGSKPSSKLISCSLDLEVAFYDVDSYRIVWHGNYPKYFEQARCALLEKIAYPYAEMEASQFFFPIIDLQIRYVQAIEFKQKIRVTATLHEWRNALVIKYEITDKASGERLTKGSTRQVAVKMPEQITQFESPAILIEKVERLLSELK